VSARETPEQVVRIGVSSCLLGQNVRFDGGHKRDPFLVGTFGRFVEWVPVCPELELGLGVPRESIRLERHAEGTRLVAPRSGADHTDAMTRFARKRVRALLAERLDGFVLKKDSPTCGMERVRVYDRNGVPTRTGTGLFAATLAERLPELPTEEEGRLNDPRLRENFIERVFAHGRLRRLFAGRWTRGELVAFHSAHKIQLMAHSPKAYQDLGRLVAGAKRVDRSELKRRYGSAFMEALRVPATPRRHANALAHMAGHLRKLVSGPDRQELARLIEDYRVGLVPLVVPITLLNHHVTRLGLEYLQGQHYLAPHPRELMLRNHV
jgi:uncharacterized protein YbgA (DUF1722 family)/uncharacterized protein YbbK (DUF523 family)